MAVADPPVAHRDPLSIRLTGYIPTRRIHPKQHAFLALETTREAFYGGAAGGGKSAALLMAALQFVDVPGYSAVILRKTHAQLDKADSIQSQAHQWLRGTDARWSGSKNTFYFPSGATLEFGHLQHETDKFNYQGAAYQFVGFDELTQFLESEYRYLFSRLRGPAICEEHQEQPRVAHGVLVDDQVVCEYCGRPAPALALVPTRMRAASNPGGLGHMWVRSRFILREVQDGDELRDEEHPLGALDTDGSVLRTERLFIPAKLADNPSLNQAGYMAQLSELDPQTRRQLLDGDWNAREPGACFTEFVWDRHTVGGSRHEESKLPVYKCIDFGLHHAVCLWVEVAGGRQAFVFAELHSQDKDLDEFSEDINSIDREFGTEGSPAYIDPAGLGTSYQTGKTDADVLREHGISVANLDNSDRYSRESRTSLIKRLLRTNALYTSQDECPYVSEALLRAKWDRIGVNGPLKDCYKKDGLWDHPLDALGEGLIRIFPASPAAAVETEPSFAGVQYSTSPYG